MRSLPRPAGPGVVLAVLCLSVFVINVSTTIVNIALPTLVARARRDDPRPAVDRRRVQPRVRRVRAGRRLAQRPLRAPRRGCSAGWRCSSSPRSPARRRDDPGTLIAWRALAGLGAAVDLPHHPVDHRQRLPGARRARARRSACGARRPAPRSRPGRSSAASCSSASGGARSSSSPAPSRRSLSCSPCSCVPDARATRRRRGSTSAACVLSTLGARRARARDHRGAGARLGLARTTPRRLRARDRPARRLRARGAARRGSRCSTCACSPTCASPPPAARSPSSFFALFGFIFLITQYFQFLKATGRWRPACGSCPSRSAWRSARCSAPGSRSRSAPSSSSPAGCC